MIGKNISHYIIIEIIGGGGMGIIYKALDLNLDRLVALKFLPSTIYQDDDAKQRFINEAKAASSLQHQNICTIHEIDETDEGQLFICMDCYEGQTLRQKIKSGLLDIDETIDISIQVSQGLYAAHKKGVIHRDIKPGNIFITYRNEVKILDFGLAKSSAYSKITKIDSTKGTITYISPEQAQGKEATHQSDIWSLGVVMYEMLTGQVPFKGDVDQVIIYSILDKEPEKITALNPEIPLELENIISKALEKKREVRYQNIEEMFADLMSFKNKSSGLNSDQLISSPKRKQKRFETVIISALIVLVASIVFYFVNPNFFSGLQNDIPISIAVISFENQTGDSSYNYLQKAIPNLLITNLEQAEYLQVTTWERMRDLLKQIGKGEVEVIDKELAFELCRIDGIDAMVVGSFIKAGDVFVTDVKVLDASSKKLLKSTNIKSKGVQSILESQIDYLSDEIVEGIGLSAGEIESVQLRIANVSTKSMEAYNYYLSGREEYEKNYIEDAVKLFEKAIVIDSSFAVAHLYLAWSYNFLRYTEKWMTAYERAKNFSEKSTEKVKLKIDAAYAESVEGDHEKSFRILKQLEKKYPKEKDVYISLAGYYRGKQMTDEVINEYNKVLQLDPNYGPAFNMLGQAYSDKNEFNKAIDYFNKYTSLYPNDADPFDAMGRLYFKIGRLNTAITKFKEALKIKPGFDSGLRIAYIYAFKENYPEAMKWLDQFIASNPSPGKKAQGFLWKLIYHTLSGHFKQSLIEVDRLIELYKVAGHKIGIANLTMMKGMVYLDYDKYVLSISCLEEFHDLLQEFPSLNFHLIYSFLFRGFAEVHEGRIDSAKSRLAEAESLILTSVEDSKYGAQSPYATEDANIKYAVEIGNSYIEALRMEIMLAENAFEDAIVFGENINPINSTRMTILYLLSYNLPFLQDVLARAYYLNGELDKAIAEYERLITFDPTSNNRRLIHPRYHYLLAKLYEEKGWKKKAVAEFNKFLDLWKDADKELPEFIDSNNRLAKLLTVSVK